MAISKIVAKSVDFQAADGEIDNDYALRIANAEATDGRSYGLRIDAGSTSDEAFIVKDHDSSNTLIKIDGYGHITKPKQPAFLVKPDANQDSLAINTYHTVQFDEEKFDQNGDFNTTNYTFTAPVTGRYQLNTSVYLYNVDEGADYYLIYIDTSNNDYSVILDPGGYDGDINYQSWVVSMLADMDASDTAVVKVYQQAGSQQVNLIAGAYTWFSGYLVA